MNEHPHHLVMALVDGELRPGEQEAVAAHLAQCPACRLLLESATAVRQWLQQTPAIPLITQTELFWQRLAPRLPARGPALGAGWIWGIVMLFGAIVAEAVVLVLALAAPAAAFGLLPGLDLAAVLGADSSWLAAIQYVQAHSLLGMFLNSPAIMLVPYLLVLALAVGLALGFLGWGLAALRGANAAPAGATIS